MNNVVNSVEVSPAVAMGKIISYNSGRIFSVKFTKKDGSERKMVCRKGVRKGLTGKGAKYNPIERGLISVYDVHKGDYRMINFDTLQEFKMGGTSYKITSFILS